MYGANLYDRCLRTLNGEVLQTLHAEVERLVSQEHPELLPMPSAIANATRLVPSLSAQGESVLKRVLEGSIGLPALLQELAPDGVIPKNRPGRGVSFLSILVLRGVYQVRYTCLVKLFFII